MAKKKHAQKKESKFTLWQKIAMIILFLLIFIAGVILYSRYIATSKIEVREIKVINQNLPSDYHGFKIVQLSDIHYNTTIYKEELNKIVQKINKMKQ